MSQHSNFLDLNDDIICFHLVPLLEPRDIISLFLTCKQLYQTLNNSIVWHQLLKKSFHSDQIPLELQYKWPKLYKLLKNAKLFTWGSNDFGRLGVNTIPDELVEFSPRVARRMIKPYNISLFDDEPFDVVDICGSGFSFQLLTSDGQVYYTGTNYLGMLGRGAPGPKSIPHRRLPNIMRLDTVNKVITDQPDIKFIEVSSGRTHFIALDNNRHIWTWDERSQHKNGIRLNLIHPQVNAPVQLKPENYILKIRAGWGKSSCLINHLGIAVWNTRHNKSSESGLANAPVSIVEGTKQDRVVDYIVLDNHIIYITYSGELFKAALDGDLISKSYSIPRGRKLTDFHDYVNTHSSRTRATPNFVRIAGNFNKFAVITNDDQVLLGMSSSASFTVYPELQHNSIISIAVGDHHYLALNKRGEVYAWGKELRLNGCCGFGELSNVLENELGRTGGGGHQTLEIEKPTKIQMFDDHEDVALAIAAGGWHSAALVGKRTDLV